MSAKSGREEKAFKLPYSHNVIRLLNRTKQEKKNMSSCSSSAWAVTVAGSFLEETKCNVKEKMINTEQAADEFIEAFRGELKMQRLNSSLVDASASAIVELKMECGSNLIGLTFRLNWDIHDFPA